MKPYPIIPMLSVLAIDSLVRTKINRKSQRHKKNTLAATPFLPGATVLLVQLIHRFLRSLGPWPGIGPETEVDGPPVVRNAGTVQLRQDGAEINLALAEWSVSAGLVIVEGTVRVD